jgi:ribonucleotide monophosphatase NagD (HAD superfamily)
MSIKIGSLKEISQKYTTFFFDLDGVIVPLKLLSGKANKRSREALRHWSTSRKKKKECSS